MFMKKKLEKRYNIHKILAVADPGFPRGACQTIIWSIFPENYIHMKKV